MQRRHDPADISAAAQEYLLALRVMGSDGRVATTAQLGRHVGVTTQAASEMCRRLAADGLVEPATGRGLELTAAGRAAADAIFRRHALLEWLLTSVVGLTWAESDVEAMRLQGALSPARRVQARRAARAPRDVPARQPDRPRDRAPATGRHAARGDGVGSKATVLRITEEAEEDAGLLSYLEARALTPGAAITILVAQRVAGLADARGPARPGDARPAAGGADPRAPRRRRPGPVPQGPGAARRLSRRGAA